MILSYFNFHDNASQIKRENTIDSCDILSNTLNQFKSDIQDTYEYEYMEMTLDRINDFFIEDDKKRKTLSNYLIGSSPQPFTKDRIERKGKFISIKFYLVLCFSYRAYFQKLIVEKSKSMMKDKTKYSQNIDEILSTQRKIDGIPLLNNYIISLQKQLYPRTIDLEYELKELKIILSHRKEYYYHHLANIVYQMLDRKPEIFNHFLKLLEFKTIGHNTTI